MCYLCKYQTYQYNKTQYNPITTKFIQYIHNREAPITDLYTQRDKYIEQEYPHAYGSHRRDIKVILNNFITHVSREENTHIVEDIPTYTMNRDGKYKRIR